MSDKLKVWAEIKKRAPDIIKEGGNPIDLLLWSQGKTLGNKHERSKALFDDSLNLKNK